MPNRIFASESAVEVRSGHRLRRRRERPDDRQFNADAFEAAFRGDSRESKLLQLWKFAEFIAFTTKIRHGIIHVDDLISELFEKAVPIIDRKLREGPSVPYFGTALRKQAEWIIAGRCRDRAVHENLKRVLEYAMTMHDSPLNAIAGLPSRLKFGEGRRDRRRKPLPEEVQQVVSKYLTGCIKKTVEKINAIDDGSGAHSARLLRLYGFLDCLQEVRKEFIGFYSQQTTPRVKFIRDRRIRRGSSESYLPQNRRYFVKTPSGLAFTGVGPDA